MLSGPQRPPSNRGAFSLIAPAGKVLLTSSRRPTFRWAAEPGTQSYEIWLNVSRGDYDFKASGSLLDVYTKVGTSRTTSFTPNWSIPDRWTYRWYVTAVGTNGSRQTSNVEGFGMYIPSVQADGIVPIINGARDLNKNGIIDRYENWRLPITARVQDLLARMTSTEKAYQTLSGGHGDRNEVPLTGWVFSKPNVGLVERDADHRASSRTRLGIPMIAAGDQLAGFKTTYPAQSALAAARNYRLDYELADMQRAESVAWGQRGTLGPLAEVGTKVLYPRIMEGNGENVNVASAQVRALVSGLHGGPELNPRSILATVKHWSGQGAQGETQYTSSVLERKLHHAPFIAAVEAGAANIMPGYSNDLALDTGRTGQNRGYTSATNMAYMRQKLNYNGLVTTDWAGGNEAVPAINASASVMGGLLPGDIADISVLTAPGQPGHVTVAALDAAVSRILTVKFKMGLFERPYSPNLATAASRQHTPQNVALVTRAARESLTLLKNNGALPLAGPQSSRLTLRSGDSIDVVGSRALDPQAGIWGSAFSLDRAPNYVRAIADRAQRNGVTVNQPGRTPKVAVVAVGESSAGYSHATVNRRLDLSLQPGEVSLINSYHSRGIPVVVALTMPRPMVMTDWLAKADAVVVTYRGGDGV
ncbi:MAG: glycoside hydrolase family 3 N-terminal domain-containing protein, partial [Angustibacter sp.]